MRSPAEEVPALLNRREVAELLRVSPVTVTRWSQRGLLTTIRTPGGHRRYYETEVRALLGTPSDQPA